MPRHSLHPLSRSRAPLAGPSSKPDVLSDPTTWSRMDRAQVLGTPGEGHRGCVNALSWSDDGSTLLSGSDDKRICIWASDPDSLNTTSPHPMKLVDTIATGHRANIFSAKFLPNTNTPTIVSCAGDKQVRVFEVERLGRMDMAGGRSQREELYGLDGPGVRVLQCHTDRTKRIATENSPDLFLTVSEDGTVRQHDLRRPHNCRSECPEALFRAPRNVDLYSLSVSTVTPHMFAVAGRTDCAYVCDRRMLERQTPSWGPNVKESGQVHCVRRLGLTNEDWESAGVMQRGPFAEPRHITCVKMSPDRADEVICAFAQHSTSIFSTFDSPTSASMRHASPTLPASPRVKAAPNSSIASPPRRLPVYSPSDFERSPGLGKRRQSDLSSVQPNPSMAARRRISEEAEARNGNDDAARSTEQNEGGEVQGTRSVPRDDRDEDESMFHFDQLDADFADDPEAGPSLPLGIDRNRLPSPPSGPIELGHSDPTAALNLDAEDLAHLRSVIEGDDDDDDDNMDMEDEDEFDSDEFDDYDEYADDDDDDVDDDDFGDIYDDGEEDGQHWTSPAEFAAVDMITPRRSFKGAKNMETVKDCNFLGSRSDKVCSGSDDGNFFVWDKETGRLEGIWAADGHVVNVMEQHPTLPVVAVSGIDNTVKLFAPLNKPPSPSFSRLHLKDQILHANADRSHHQPPSAFGNASLIEFLASRGIQARFMGAADDGDGEEGQQECTTQ